MGRAMSDGRVTLFLDLVYQAAAAPGSWWEALEGLASLFSAAAVDLSTRSPDNAHSSAITYDVDRCECHVAEIHAGSDAWRCSRSFKAMDGGASRGRPVEGAQIQSGGISHEDRDPFRHQESLCLPLWVGDREVQEIVIRRPGASGAFGAEDIELAHTLLPHLQRAAAVTRRLRDSDFRLEVGACGAGCATIAVVVFDSAGLPFWFNAAADMLLAEGSVLILSGGELQAVSPGSTCALRRAVDKACGRMGRSRESAAVTLAGAAGLGSINAMVMPLSNAADWATSRPPAAKAMLRQPVSHAVSREWLREVFPLTEAEVALAQALMAGRSLRSVAEGSGRSLHTVRSHLAHLMEKTETNKQADLVRLLGDVAALGAPRARPAEKPRFNPPS